MTIDLVHKEKSDNLVNDITDLIKQAKNNVAQAYNSAQVLLCWSIGKRIESEILLSTRAEYGEEIVKTLSYELSISYGKGYSRPNLFRMVKLAKLFPDYQIVSTLSRQLSWSHLIMICGIEEELKREFYLEMIRLQRWSVRTFKQQLDSMLYERTAISKHPQEVIAGQINDLKVANEVSADMIFKDPYFINFIGNNNYESEADLENAILTNITDFLQELGSEFCFVARQKRMSTGKKDRYLDLLFFHRRLRRLIALDLKIGNFEPSYKGQMEWYLNWLDIHERFPNEEKPLGIILCAGKDQEDIEYLEMDKTGIHVAQYLTVLPSKNILENKLKQAIALAKENHIKTLIDKTGK
jgi:predicted nuclease of restriction endonuclease-like (RecB) superfamily